jgi:hypothetical protein
MYTPPSVKLFFSAFVYEFVMPLACQSAKALMIAGKVYVLILHLLVF